MSKLTKQIYSKKEKRKLKYKKGNKLKFQSYFKMKCEFTIPSFHPNNDICDYQDFK